MIISKGDRQRLSEDYMARHGGVYDPAGFVAEVRETGPKHPAWGWFDFDDVAGAAEQWWISRAREFVQDLRISFRVEEIGRRGKMAIRTVETPLLISPMKGRTTGGGYVSWVGDADQEKYIEELRAQTVVDLRAWQKRFGLILLKVGVEADVNRLITRIETGSRNS
jgi:hypothetical protein